MSVKIDQTDRGTLVSMRFEKISVYESIALVKNKKTEKTFWRHRYYISNGKTTHFAKWEDYPRKKFTSMRTFKRFIENKDPYDGQVFSRGVHWDNKPLL